MGALNLRLGIEARHQNPGSLLRKAKVTLVEHLLCACAGGPALLSPRQYLLPLQGL